MLARNTNVTYLYQTKEKLALWIKGLYIHSIKEAKKILVVLIWERKTFLFDLQF